MTTPVSVHAAIIAAVAKHNVTGDPGWLDALVKAAMPAPPTCPFCLRTFADCRCGEPRRTTSAEREES